MQFDKGGKMLQAWNRDTVRVTEGTGRGTPDGGDIYVVDIKNWRVQKWSR